ncbi:YciI family protein [Nitratireductor kimnyeongensis]|uniref:YciI family protein n=1 Tax=Nitratireductor kimnyeongensis TaxID=430679 RepID=A0ABW0T8Y9_9HYPH|nr:YciI family protein [Nitratireductor kimnyeongensis]QZZ36128.1 YciI family protein [Nitratireductor kimnyeongensis]
MRYMLLMIPKGYETAGPELDLPADAVAKMMAYNEELRAAGVLEALEGLHPPSTGARVSFASGEPVVIDGPFIEAKEVLGGFWIINVPTFDDALEWAKRCPGAPNETIEIRKIQQMEDYSDEVQEIVKTYPDVLEKGIDRS